MATENWELLIMCSRLHFFFKLRRNKDKFAVKERPMAILQAMYSIREEGTFRVSLSPTSGSQNSVENSTSHSCPSWAPGWTGIDFASDTREGPKRLSCFISSSVVTSFCSYISNSFFKVEAKSLTELDFSYLVLQIKQKTESPTVVIFLPKSQKINISIRSL